MRTNGVNSAIIKNNNLVRLFNTGCGPLSNDNLGGIGQIILRPVRPGESNVSTAGRVIKNDF